MSDNPPDNNSVPSQQWPPARPSSSQTTKPRVSSGSLRDRIAKFNDLSAGSAPLLPSSPFGLGAPPAHAQSQARGGLIGNRIPSMDPKTAGILPGAPSNLRKPSESGGARSTSVTASRSEGRSASPAQSVASSATSADPGAPDTVSPATSRSASPSRAPAQTNTPSHLVVSSLPDQGDGAVTPSSTIAEASESSTSLPLSTQESTPNSLSKKNLNLNSELAPDMARQDSDTSAQASIAAPSVSSMQAQYEPSSTGSAEVTKMIDVSGVSTPMGTPRAAQRDLASEQDSQQGEDSVAGDTNIIRAAEDGSQLPAAADLSDIHLRQSDAELNPTADIEDVVGARDQAGLAMPAQNVSINLGDNGAAALAGEKTSDPVQPAEETSAASPEDLASIRNAEDIVPVKEIESHALLAAPTALKDTAASSDEQEETMSQVIFPEVPPTVEVDTNAREGTASLVPSKDREVEADEGLPLAQQTSANSLEPGPAIDGQGTKQADESAIVAGLPATDVVDGVSLDESRSNEIIPAKPRARLGPTEVVYLPNSDSEDDDDDIEGRSDDEGADQQDGDFLSEHPDNTEDLHLRHMRLTTESLLPLRLSRFGQHLQRLCLRQNALTSPLPLDIFKDMTALEELDMYDNRLGPEVTNEEVKGCPNIKTLDLSFNNLRKAPNLPDMTQVETLYLVQNKITTIQKGDLDWCKDTMRSLELGGNRLRRIENIENLVHLDELWLGKNKIRVLENLDTFSNLKILSMQSNRITKIGGLEGLVNLEELYFSHNGLTKLEGLEKNLKLRTLDVGNNQIAKIENISHLKCLEEFWASYNLIPDLRDLDSELATLPALETVYLEGNPCQKNDMAGYRRKVILALPHIKQIDANYVQPVPYAIKSVSQHEDASLEAGKIQDVTPTEVAAEDAAPLDASAAEFPAAPTDTPIGSSSDSGQGEVKPSTPLDPSFLKSFPSVPNTSDEANPSRVDSDRVRVEVIVPPSPERVATVQSTTSIAEAEGDVAVSLVPEPSVAEPSELERSASLNKKTPAKSPLLDDEDPGDFEEGWATVTKGRDA